ncbi:MAG: serine hydrolase [Gammaproteobacteria bacterium]|nr:serine hydrolase [Gammaproteobacteria bacterium]
MASASAAGQTLRDREIAAGYQAIFLCSDNFVAHMPEATIRNDDLPGWRFKLDPSWPSAIDRATKSVSVKFDSQMPPRIAVWRRLLGCAQLPIGATLGVANRVPKLPNDMRAPSLDHKAWPLGDAHAIAQLPAARKSALDALVAKAFDDSSYGKGTKTSAVLVLQDGRIVAERYGLGMAMHTPQRTWSMAKSLAATLMGRAVELGRIKVSKPANIPQWRHPGDPRAAITTNQLLRMNSGLWTDGPGNHTVSVYWGGGTVTQTSAVMPLEAEPGSRFNYANNDILLATYGLMTTLGSHALAFPFTEVLWPLGMTHTTPEIDWQGNYVMSSQVWMTARDSARLALLYENDGVANGKRLLPKDWAHFVSSTSGAQPGDTHGWQYGAGFWVFGPRNGLPPGSFGMAGSRGQYAIIVPSAKVIVVRRGFDPIQTRFDITQFTHDVLQVLSGAGAHP